MVINISKYKKNIDSTSLEMEKKIKVLSYFSSSQWSKYFKGQNISKVKMFQRSKYFKGQIFQRSKYFKGQNISKVKYFKGQNVSKGHNNEYQLVQTV